MHHIPDWKHFKKIQEAKLHVSNTPKRPRSKAFGLQRTTARTHYPWMEKTGSSGEHSQEQLTFENYSKRRLATHPGGRPEQHLHQRSGFMTLTFRQVVALWLLCWWWLAVNEGSVNSCDLKLQTVGLISRTIIESKPSNPSLNASKK